MSGTYLTNLADVLRGAGLNVVEYNGWQSRARSSGGFPSGRPWCIMWHHTASSPSASAQQDADYMCINKNNSNRPTANLMIARDGSIWVLAAGATNTNGKGKPIGFSKGTVPNDSMNTYAIGIEMCNNGVGEAWSEAMINTAFAANNALAAAYGLQPTDLATHNFYAPDRKIDPAVAESVQGPWVPPRCTSSGTWDRGAIQNEAAARAAGPPPEPTPVPPEPTPIPPPVVAWPASLTSTLPTIRKGDSGWMVKRMQHLLAAHGYMQESNVSNYDGQWGNGTDGAKLRFDTDHGFGDPNDTSCGGKSWAALCGDMPSQSKGASGFNVKIMQHLLAACGFMNEGNVSNYDGAWGNGTDKAKVNFDNAAGLTPSPPTDCGQKSWTALMVS